MADGKIEIIIRSEGGTGGSGGGRSSAGDEKDRLQSLLNQLNATDSLIVKQRLMKKIIAEIGNEGDRMSVVMKKGLERINEKVREFNNIGKQSQNTWSSALNSYQFKFNALGNIISSVTSMAMRFVREGIRSVINISKEFESAMAGVKAITNATSEEFDKLRKNAISLGGATIYTAKQVALLQMQLGKLGFTTDEIINATNGILSLAAATDEDLTRAAMVAGSTLRAFNLNAIDTNRVVDVMARSFTTSALDLERFTESMKFLGPVANQVGFTMGETTAILGKLADKMIYGSLAGTSMRNIMLRFADENSKLSQAIGFSVTSVAELAVAMDILKKKGLDATMALSLTDRRAVTTMLALSDMSNQLLEYYSNVIDSHDAANKMADIRMDTFAGSVEKLNGAWESFVQTINQGNGVLKVFVDAMRIALDDINTIMMGRQGRLREISQQEIQDLKKNVDQRVTLEAATNAEIARLHYLRYKKGEETEKQFLEISKSLKEEQSKFEKKIFDEYVQAEIMKYEDLQDHLEKMLSDEKQRHKKRFKDELDATRAHLNSLNELYLAKQTERIQGEMDLEEEQAQAMHDMQVKDWEYRIETMREGEEKELEQIQLNNFKKMWTYRDYDGVREAFDAKASEQMAALREKNRKKGESDLRKQKKEEQAIRDYYDKMAAEITQNETVIAKQREDKRYNDELRMLEEAHEEGILKTDKYFEALGLAQAIHSQNILRIIKADFQKRTDELGKFYEDQKKTNTGFFTLKPMTGYETIGNETDSGQTWIEQLFGTIDDNERAKEELVKLMEKAVGEIGKFYDKQVEYADRAVDSSRNRVDQLQRDLEIEISLAEKGFASNVSLRQRELDDAKRAQNIALQQQAQALKKQEQLEMLAQTISMGTAIAELLKNTFKTIKEPITATIIGLALAATVIAAFGGFKSQIKSEAGKYAEGGEVGGRKHSQGGTLIEAEKGEYVVKARQVAKHRDLIEAINNDKLNTQWKSLNHDLSVSLDDTNTARMMGKYFGRQITPIPNGRIERYGNRTRTIRYV